MAENKFYLLYNNKQQEKLLTTASSYERLTGETQYYSEGVWFEYEYKDGSNFLFNEKLMKGINFPTEPKKREVKEFGGDVKPTFKWVG